MKPVNDTVWRISALNFEVKTMLEQGIGRIWVEAEISNFSQPASGHWYLTLKDERSQCRAAMFKGQNRRVKFTPENGQQVLVRAQVTLYEARGDFQLILDHMEPAGIGQLMRQYELLKAKLDQEGLFAASLKKTLPYYPHKIGVITSASGAAIKDALSVFRRRSPSTPLMIYPTPVQGEHAAESIIRALKIANQQDQCDVLLLIRGGGSLEDMSCFNDEALARAIAKSEIPIVTGIGHEIDFTIADFVADIRAPTPSVAAETVSPDQFDTMQHIDELLSRLIRVQNNNFQSLNRHFSHLNHRIELLHPDRQLQHFRQRISFAQNSLVVMMQNQYKVKQSNVTLLQSRLHQRNPKIRLVEGKHRVSIIQQNLLKLLRNTTDGKAHQIELLASELDTLSPLKTLSRGFARVTRQNRGISSASQLKTDDQIDITFSDGEKQAKVI